MISRMLSVLFARGGAVIHRVPAEVAPRRSPHAGAITRGGFAAARVPA